jgi:hypothetical protein
MVIRESRDEGYLVMILTCMVRKPVGPFSQVFLKVMSRCAPC